MHKNSVWTNRFVKIEFEKEDGNLVQGAKNLCKPNFSRNDIPQPRFTGVPAIEVRWIVKLDTESLLKNGKQFIIIP